MAKTINILGATGSIGQSAADVIAANADEFDVRLITAHENQKLLDESATRLGAKTTALTADDADWLEKLDQPVDLTICAIAGMAGLPSMMQAIRHSKVVAIANKEPLVAAGPQVMAAAREYGTTLLPIDSEHNAIFQVFDPENKAGIEKIILTASGGPFRTWDLADMAKATPEQALAHPNWSMGRKISIDSATMMNKALEIIEAHILFALPPEQIEVLIHPQSVVHSMVEYADGSVLAQMGASDMRTPIAHVLGWPKRINTPGQRLDLSRMKNLSFETPDLQKFPALSLAYDCLKQGQAACIALNAANELAVAAFLDRRVDFLAIMDIIRYALANIPAIVVRDIESVIAADQAVRRIVTDYINNLSVSKPQSGKIKVL